MFISSVSAYVGWPVQPLTEDSPVLDCPPDAGPDFGYDADPGPTGYGFTKAGCERAVLEVFGPNRTTILRPGVILGPHEHVGRLPWWLRRVQRGGRILAPGHPDRTVQPVDVRDVATFALDGPAGTFNLTGPSSPMERLLRACAEVVDADQLDTTWITDEQWLVEQGVAQWTELPLWRTYRGTWRVSSSAALRAGFTPRRLQATVADTWAWMTSSGAAVAHERSSEHGIAPEKETAILGIWDARELDHCG